MFFYDILPRLLALRTKMKVEGVNLLLVLPVRVRVALLLFMLILEMYLIFTSCVFLLSITNSLSPYTQ
jgi:hypothetical protein